MPRVRWKVVETDNFGGDYPNEKWATPYSFTYAFQAQNVADALNTALSGEGASRFWKVVPSDYELQPGFEP